MTRESFLVPFWCSGITAPLPKSTCVEMRVGEDSMTCVCC